MYDQNGQRRRVVQKTQPAMGPFAIFVTVFIVIVFIAASFCAGYYVGSNYKLNIKNGSIEKATKASEDAVVTDYKLTDPQVANLLNNLAKGSGADCQAIEDFVNDRKITVDDVSNTRAFIVAEMNNYYTSGISSIPEKEYKKEVSKYFGKSYTFNPNLIQRDRKDCSRYEYNPDKKAFEKKDNGCDKTCDSQRTVFKMIKATDYNGKLEIDVKVLFAGQGNGYYYRDYNRKDIVCDSSSVSSYILNGADYKFKFKIEDGKYVFVSSEPVK